MHGELMEFNSRLQRQLQVTEHELNRTRAELVHLRGPLPIDFYPQDGRDHSDERDPCATATPLVHVWIPSAFLVQGSSDPHHIYQVFLLTVYCQFCASDLIMFLIVHYCRFISGSATRSGQCTRDTLRCMILRRILRRSTLLPRDCRSLRRKSSDSATRRRWRIAGGGSRFSCVT